MADDTQDVTIDEQEGAKKPAAKKAKKAEPEKPKDRKMTPVRQTNKVVKPSRAKGHVIVV